MEKFLLLLEVKLKVVPKLEKNLLFQEIIKDILSVLIINLIVKVGMMHVQIVVLTMDIVMMENVNVVLDGEEKIVLPKLDVLTIVQ